MTFVIKEQKFYHDAAELAERVSRGCSLTEIALEGETHTGQILHYLKKFKIPTNWKKGPKKKYATEEERKAAKKASRIDYTHSRYAGTDITQITLGPITRELRELINAQKGDMTYTEFFTAELKEKYGWENLVTLKARKNAKNKEEESPTESDKE